MTIYEGITLGFIAVGIFFIIIGFTFDRTKKVIKDDEVALEDEAFRTQVNLIDEKVLELNDYHDFVQEEIDKKHKELLFLYQMITEKERAIKEIQIEIEKLRNHKEEAEDLTPEEMEVKVENSNRRIISLKEQGYQDKEIAKILGIGLGEVQLVLNLFE